MAKTSEENRARFLLRSYGITAEEFDALTVKQAERCAVCDNKQHTTMQVDYDYATRSVRGLLCRNCGHALRLLGHNVGTLTRAADYLQGE